MDKIMMRTSDQKMMTLDKSLQSQYLNLMKKVETRHWNMSTEGDPLWHLKPPHAGGIIFLAKNDSNQ